MKVMAKKDKITKKRVKKGLTGSEIAKRVGITSKGYFNIETNYHGANPDTAKSICDVLNADFDELFEIKN